MFGHGNGYVQINRQAELPS